MVSRTLILLLLVFGPCRLFSQEIRSFSMVELDSLIKTTTQPLVVSFWATWCAPCINEIPWIEKAVMANKDKGVELWLVSLNGPGYFPEKLRQFIREKGYTAQFFWLKDQDGNDYGKRIHPRWRGGLPANLFVHQAKGYRKFLERQVTDRQAFYEIEQMLK